MDKKNNKHINISSSLAIITCFASPLWAQPHFDYTDPLITNVSNPTTIAQDSSLQNKDSSPVRIRSVALKQKQKVGASHSSNESNSTSHK